MKKNSTKFKIYLIIVTMGIFSVLGFNKFISKNPQKDIVGTWILESKTSNYKLIFTKDGICKEFDEGNLVGTNKYEIAYHSCEEYHVDGQLFLKWIDTADSEVSCFEIKNISDKYLSIMFPGNGRLMFFNKKK